MLTGSSPLAMSWAKDVFRAPGWKGGGLQFMLSDSVPTVRPEPLTPFAARACGPFSDTSPCVIASAAAHRPSRAPAAPSAATSAPRADPAPSPAPAQTPKRTAGLDLRGTERAQRDAC